jgi:hypothetical protein
MCSILLQAVLSSTKGVPPAFPHRARAGQIPTGSCVLVDVAWLLRPTAPEEHGSKDNEGRPRGQIQLLECRQSLQ